MACTFRRRFICFTLHDVEPVLINADAPCKLTTSCEIERWFYAMRWKVIIRHYRPGNGCTACRRSLDSVCDVIMFIVPSGRLLGNLGNVILRHVKWPREICRSAASPPLKLLSFRSYEIDKTVNYPRILNRHFLRIQRWMHICKCDRKFLVFIFCKRLYSYSSEDRLLYH